ncbi:MAG: hypothetical protein LBB13_03270 [Rickettsiales bacterium]|nr:hypothetical protein [Rickettsiales bacterium]
MKCKYCYSEKIKCNGNKYGKQRYYCNNCSRSFSENDGRVKRSSEQKRMCLPLYVHSMSKNSIRRVIELYFNTKISYDVIVK